MKTRIEEGRRPELVGGGIIRYLGGWSAVSALRRSGDRELSDDRILGSGEFVERTIKEAHANVRYQFSVNEQTGKIDEYIAQVCKKEKVSIEVIKAGGLKMSKAR